MPPAVSGETPPGSAGRAMTWDITLQAELGDVSGAALRGYLAEASPGAQPSDVEELDEGELLRQAVEHCVREWLVGLGAPGRYTIRIRREQDETWHTAGDIEAAIREEHPPRTSAPLSGNDLEARRLGEELAEGKD